MGKEVKLFKSEEKRSLGEVADFLRKLADRLDKGRVVLSQGDKKLKLKLPEVVEMEIEVEKEIGKRTTEIEMEIELKWQVDKSGNPKDKKSLSIE
ncbi:amphi-Trp domain-containing protein [Desulfobulbus alkaliphilus]|uniref:amphi-Trp domain-containing protein n=1 Tax=Desulfobulbus alkaliphilus TaxID=869814 RepID=UPI001963C503|nr:amphi-Trp domain-containing protein [Desulfobulbus alkaliphilus]MBM9537643.1 amphi-Trp domain-containing protein [Desulfobulbus alkaliphilus]